jgi:hypothetical protein
MYKAAFLVTYGLPQDISRDLRPATIVYNRDIGKRWIIANVNFSKIVAFEGMIRIFFYVVAAHFEGLGIRMSWFLVKILLWGPVTLQ